MIQGFCRSYNKHVCSKNRTFEQLHQTTFDSEVQGIVNSNQGVYYGTFQSCKIAQVDGFGVTLWNLEEDFERLRLIANAQASFENVDHWWFFSFVVQRDASSCPSLL